MHHEADLWQEQFCCNNCDQYGLIKGQPTSL